MPARKPEIRPQEVNEAQRRVRALSLRATGKTIPEIADELGVGHNACREAIKRGMAEIEAVSEQSAREYRRLHLERLSALRSVCWQHAKLGRRWAITELRKIDESERRLLGLDAPKAITLANGIFASNTDGNTPATKPGISDEAAELVIDRILAPKSA